MHLNRVTGSAAMGYAAVSVDGVVPAALAGQSAGNPDGPCWLNATTLMYQNFTSGTLVQTYDVGTHALATLTPAGANLVAGGAGIWGAGLKTTPAVVRSNVPGVTGPLSGAFLGDVSNDGELVVITTYPAMRGLTVYGATGAILLALPAVTVIPMSGTSVLRLRDHLLVYLDAATGWTMHGVAGATFRYAPRVTTGTAINCTVPVVTAGGTIYVLETSDLLTLRQADKGVGWQLHPTGTLAFNPDVVELTPGVLRIGWSANAGESADALHLLDLTLATGATVDWTVVGGTLVATPGPTLATITVPVGPVQGSGTGGTAIAPLAHPVVDAATGDRITRPWAMYFQQLQTGQAATTQALASTPPAVAPPASFGVVVGGGVPVAATTPTDTLTLTSTDSSVTITANPVTQTVDLTASGGGGGSDHYDCPLSDGDPVAADLIFASGECIIVQVPV